jgi:fatty acyl-CoA reductase
MSSIQSFFKGKNVLITGATGFIGHVLKKTLQEKIPEIAKITCLYHTTPPPPEAILHTPVEWLQADLCQPDFGFSKETLTRLSLETHVVFHLSAYTRWDKGVKDQVQLNTVSTLAFLDWVSKFDHLESCFLASSYWASLHNRKQDDEYKECIHQDDQAEKEIEDILLHGTSGKCNEWPNPYSYSKNLMERVTQQRFNQMPIVMGRITSVCGAWEFPKRGFCYFDNALPAFVKAVASGSCSHFPMGIQTGVNDSIPVDICVNLMLANVVYNANKPLCVIHLSSATRNVLTTGQIAEKVAVISYHPTMKDVMDFLAKEKTKSAKLNQMILTHYQIGIEERHVFLDDVARRPLESMTPKDKLLFPCRMEDVDWNLIIDAMAQQLVPPALSKV